MKPRAKTQKWSHGGDLSTTDRKLSFEGNPFAPTPGTNTGIDPLGSSYWSAADSGEMDLRAIRGLFPLIAAALYEVGFAWEAGPLSTWSN
jgi:hypothetical protein